MNLKFFCCPTYKHVDDDSLKPRSKKCIFVSYASIVKVYRLWYLDPKSPKILIEKDVVFHESAMLSSNGDTVAPSDVSTCSTITE